jgi:opacity protein-like surface antigen
MGSNLNCALCFAALPAIGSAASAADMLVRTPLDAGAWINPILIANTQVGLGIVGHHFDYNETTPAAPRFSSERGWTPGLQATVSAMAPMAEMPELANIYVMGRISWIKGVTAYSASGGPATSARSGAEIRDADIRFGKGFDVAANWMVTPYLGAGYHGWDRDLSNRFGPFGYHELYQHGYLGGGVLLQWAPTRQLVISANGLAGTTFNAKMTTSFNGGIPITPQDYRLGNSTIYLAGLSTDLAITREWHLNAGIDYVNWRYGASPPAPDGSLEPDSRTSNWTVKAGFGYSFYTPPVIAAK